MIGIAHVVLGMGVVPGIHILNHRRRKGRVMRMGRGRRIEDQGHEQHHAEQRLAELADVRPSRHAPRWSVAAQSVNDGRNAAAYFFVRQAEHRPPLAGRAFIR